MDQIKTGKFIASERKNKNMTQRQLADKLMISDKTISKWECGNGLPEVSLMMPLCEILEINVNELLSGERLEEKEYQKKAEENMMEFMRERQESKHKIIVGVIAAFMGVSTMVVCDLIVGYFTEIDILYKVLIIIFGIVNMIVGLGIAVWSEMSCGAFECTKCGKKFVPSTGAYLAGTHTITRRKLRCPHCGQKNYCKRTLTRK